MLEIMADGRSPLRRRVVLFPCPLQGHLNPMFQLAAALHSRGFSITVIHTQFNAPQASKHPHFRFAAPIPDGLTEEIKASDDLAGIFVALNASVEDSLRDRLADVVRRGEEEEEEDSVACLIADNVMYAGSKVSEEVGVPNFVLVTVSAALLHTFAVTPLLDLRRDEELQSQAPVLEHHQPLRERDLPHLENSNPRDAHDFTHRVMGAASASRALIWNTIEGLEADSLAGLRQQLQPPIFPIGPLHELSPNTYESFLAQDSTCTEWLDQQKPGSVVYVSFGSMACVDRRELLEIAWGLAASRQPFLWVLRPGSVRGEQGSVDLPEEFEEETGGRGKVVRWAPQQEVLGHRAVGGFWTHCGWNSVLESICKGVPMLCGPCFGDQKVNARYVTHVWEVGLPLESGLERREIEGAVKRLMVGDEGEAMRRRVLDLKAEADRCLRDGGSSRRHLDKLVELILLEKTNTGSSILI